MNNKCGCGCQNGFVPVSGNWDFNMDRSDTGCQRQRQNRCNVCDAAETVGTARQRQERCNDCENVRQRNTREDVCSGCGRARSACTCGQRNNTRTDYASCAEETNTPACVMKTAESARGRQKGMGIVRGTMQNLNDIFDNARALKAGTLFPELHKPMSGYCPCGKECGTDCQQAAFAAWELRLYLNTHPDDDQARALLAQLIGDCCEPNYATTFLTEECGRWAWTDDPWPWNIEANCCK